MRLAEPIAHPRKNPYLSIARSVYREQVGECKHLGPSYLLKNPIKTFMPFFEIHTRGFISPLELRSAGGMAAAALCGLFPTEFTAFFPSAYEGENIPVR